MAVLEVMQRVTPLLAYEFFSELAVDKVSTHAGVNRPFDTQTPFYALIEFENTDSSLEAKVFAAVEEMMEQGLVVDAVMSQSIAQARALWRLREDISETISQWTPYKNDISVTVARVPALLEAVNNEVHKSYPDWEVVWYGHIGDGNLHINILKPDDMASDEFMNRCKEADQLLFEMIKKLGGSVSAEHGVGLVKKPYLEFTRSPEEIAYMKAIKTCFDPDGIMNPGKVL